MGLKGKIVIITLITIVSLVGVGFATWTFTSPVNSDAVGVSAGAHAAIEAEDVLVQTAEGDTITTLYIICEKPGNGGIYWSTTNDSTAFSNKITQIKLVGIVNENDFSVLDFSTYTGTFTCSFEGDNSGTYFNIPAISINHDETSTDEDSDLEYLYTLPDLTYKTTPSSVSQVEDMLQEVADMNHTITFSFKVKEVND